jgi:predicted nucleotidyltransferase
MQRTELLCEIKKSLAEAYGERLKQVILFGSEARREANDDSDLDLLILLDGPVNACADVLLCMHALYDLQLKSARILHPVPASEEAYQKQNRPLYKFVCEEGVLL